MFQFVFHLNFKGCNFHIKGGKRHDLSWFHFFTSQKPAILTGVCRLFISTACVDTGSKRNSSSLEKFVNELLTVTFTSPSFSATNINKE